MLRDSRRVPRSHEEWMADKDENEARRHEFDRNEQKKLEEITQAEHEHLRLLEFQPLHKSSISSENVQKYFEGTSRWKYGAIRGERVQVKIEEALVVIDKSHADIRRLAEKIRQRQPHITQCMVVGAGA